MPALIMVICFSDHEATLTLDARLAYRNKGDPTNRWTELANSVEERRLECSIATVSHLYMLLNGAIKPSSY